MNFNLLKRWTSEQATSETPVPPLVFVDQHVATLEGIRRELTSTRARLVAAEGRWTQLKARGDDPEIEQACAELRPQLLALRQQVQRLTTEEAAEDATIRETSRLATEYAALVDATQAWLTPMLAALPTDDALADAFRRTRELSRRAGELGTRTGARQFRRSAVDPYTALRTAATEMLRVLDRQRLLRRGDVDATKTA